MNEPYEPTIEEIYRVAAELRSKRNEEGKFHEPTPYQPHRNESVEIEARKACHNKLKAKRTRLKKRVEGHE